MSQDTFRHWKQVLPPLAGRNGYRPCFTPGDLLAMALVKGLVEEVGIRISTLSTIAAELFRLCNESAWAGLERSMLVLDLGEARITLSSETQPPRTDRIAIHIACRPIIARLRGRLLAEQAIEPQQMLRFPPSAVSRERRNAGGE